MASAVRWRPMTVIEGFGIASACSGLYGYLSLQRLYDPSLYVNRAFIAWYRRVSMVLFYGGYGMILFGSDFAWWVRIIEALAVHFFFAPMIGAPIIGRIVGLFWEAE